MVMGNLFVLTAIELRHLSIHFLDDFLEIATGKKRSEKDIGTTYRSQVVNAYVSMSRACVCVCMLRYCFLPSAAVDNIPIPLFCRVETWPTFPPTCAKS